MLAAIALTLAVLLPLQIASATMARLLRPAHMHANPAAAIDRAHDGAVTRKTARLPMPTFDTVVSRIPPIAPAAAPHAGAEVPRVRAHGHSHPHANRHAPAQLPNHAHGHAHPPRHRHAPPPPPQAMAHRTALAAPEHAARLNADFVAHARAHAAGVGHHRHASDTPDVVYLDDDASPQTPLSPTTRTADVTVMLLPAGAWVPGDTVAADSPSGSPSQTPTAHYGLPGERPPR